jgi:PAT family beta-lactamase induction signal transducer AmpG
VYSVVNISAGFLGMFAGGALADLFGKKRMMSVYLISMIVLVTVMAFSKAYWQVPFFVEGFIGVYVTFYVFLTVAAFATGMSLCWKQVAATQFTLYMAMSNLGRAFGASLLGPLRDFLSWEYVILTFAVFALGMLIFIQLIHTKKHLDNIGRLESDHQNKIKPLVVPAAVSIGNANPPGQ